MSTARSVLVVLSGAKDINLKSGKVPTTTAQARSPMRQTQQLSALGKHQSQETGFFLSELYVPLNMLERAGYRYLPRNNVCVHMYVSTYNQMLTHVAHAQAHFHEPDWRDP